MLRRPRFILMHLGTSPAKTAVEKTLLVGFL
jgi:hypothetical protein